MTAPLTPEERASNLWSEWNEKGQMDSRDMRSLFAKHIAEAVAGERKRIVENMKQYANQHFPTGAIRDIAVAYQLVDVAEQEPTQ